ncbi:hypothetical protein C8R45DRAFT_135609 [Mycena sanguinolenta]|nr:hypothetical protein C8R45DRAFT_135609 [Mycena sanguinolenta]
MSLDKLPAELLFYLPNICIPSRIFFPSSRLAAASGRVFFRPHPHLLLAATARQLADWAVAEDHHRYLLEAAIHGGVDQLFELAIDVAGLSMDDVRRLCTYKCDVLNPLNRDLDVTAGPASSGPWTVCNDPEMTLLSWAIYGELFHHSLELAYLLFPPQHKPLSSIIRLKWFVYCMPDINSFDYMKFSPDEIPRFFAKGERNSASREYVDRCQQLSMDEATREFLNASLWKQELDKSPSFQATGGFSRELYISCAMHAGLKSLELLVPGGVEKLEADLGVIAAGIRSSADVDEEDADEEKENELQADESPANSKDKRLLKLIGDPWLFNVYPSLDAYAVE